MSPSSSPGGSPTTSSLLDSSPLSSPSIQPLDLDRPPTPVGISHPFSSSTHTTTHPSYELRYSNSSYTPATWGYRSDVSSSADRAKLLEDVFDEEENSSLSNVEVEPPDEATLWEEKITRAVDTGDAEFTWKYVSSLRRYLVIAFTEPLETQGLPLCPHPSRSSTASGSSLNQFSAPLSAYRLHPRQSSRLHIDHSLPVASSHRHGPVPRVS
jgi:hypothetical protein